MSLLFYFILYLLPFSWWVFLFRQKETLDGLTSGYLYVLFSPCCIQREANKKSNKILANLKVEWLKYTITNICTSIHVYLLVFCFTYHCSLSPYRLSFVRVVSLNTQSRYIWHERARLCSALLCSATSKIEIQQTQCCCASFYLIFLWRFDFDQHSVLF